jgi:hypothetical protein
MKRFLLAFAVLATSVCASATGLFVPASGRVDMVHDFKRNIVYITAGGSVLRFDRASGQFLAPIVLGGNLKGLDISADASLLAVADFARSYGPGEVVVHVVHLDEGLAVTQLRDPVDSDGETGSFSVAFGRDETLVVSTSYMGSGWLPLRRFDLTTGTATRLETVTNATMLAASGDRQRLGFAEANISDGRWGRYNFSTGLLEHRTGYDDGTSWFNYEIGVNRSGTQFAIPTYGGLYVYNDQLVRIATLGTYAGPQPLGVAYHPVQDRMYLPWVQSNQVRIYDTNSFLQVGAVTTGTVFSHEGNFAYVNGRTKLSADGSLLMVTVPGGLELHELYAPLAAQRMEVTTLRDQPVTFYLQGTIGTTADLNYGITERPTGGILSGINSMVTYSPMYGFSGHDRIGYRVRYGLAEAYSYVDIEVKVPNAPPSAANVAASGDEDTAIAVVLQGSDPDGDALAYTLLSSPANGTLSGTAPSLVFTPASNWSGTDSFTYKVGDGRLESSPASVTILVRPVNDAPVALGATVDTAEDTPVTITPQATDIENQPLTFQVVSSPANGTVTANGTTFTYTPAANFDGTDAFTFRATDGSLPGNVATITIQVTPVNDPPVANPDSATVKRREQVSIPVLANDTDVDGGWLEITSVTPPSNGSVAVVGTSIVYTSAQQGSFLGPVTFQYTINDGRAGTATATVTVTVTK